jgi:putative ABC transport system permease protein
MSKGNRFQSSAAVDYVDSVSGATNLIVIIELIGVGLALTIFSSLAALISILKYEPLKILSGRT